MNEAITNLGDIETIKHIQALTAVFKDLPTNAEGVVILPHNMKAEDISRFIPPSHIKRNVLLVDVTSFADYVNQFKTGASVIFAEITDAGAKFTAVLDYHGPAPSLAAARCAHVAVFEPQLTKEWKDWLARDNKNMPQEKFAEWLEDTQKLIIAPPGAQLLELVQNLHGAANVKFKSTMRLKDGSRKIEYDRDVTVRGTPQVNAEAMELPGEIAAGISIFEGLTPYEVRARLKTDIADHRLVLRYETIDAHLMVRAELKTMLSEIRERTQLLPFLGRV